MNPTPQNPDPSGQPQPRPVPPVPPQPPAPTPLPPSQAPVPTPGRQLPPVQYTYTQPFPPAQPVRRPAQKSVRPPVQQPVQQRVYTYQQPTQVRPMTARPPAAPLSYKMVRRKSRAPFWLAGCWVLAYAMFLNLSRWQDFAVMGAGCLLVFALSRLLIRDKQVPKPLTPAELAQMEAEHRAKTEDGQRARQEAENAASSLPGEAREFLRQMRQADVAIRDEAVSEKIRRLEARTNQIFQVVSENPEKLPEIRRFMSYYLPTLLKLLRSYDHLEEQGLDGENIRRTMQDIERILDTVVAAFDKQLDNLFQAEAMDISSDIQVLETMLSQEGLIQSDFMIKTAGDPEHPDGGSPPIQLK